MKQKADFRAVERWLYSIPRKMVALETARLDIEHIDTLLAAGEVQAVQYRGDAVSGGGRRGGLEKGLVTAESLKERRQQLVVKIKELRYQLVCFERVMELLRAENQQLAQLVQKRYIERVRPDRIIYDNILFTSRSNFYRMRDYVVQVFYESLPSIFG